MTVERRIFSYILTALAGFFLCLQILNPALADNRDDAQIFIDALADKAFVLIAKTDLTYDERQTAFQELFSEGLDIDFVAKFVLGPYRRKATDRQISDFANVLEDYIILTYAYRFEEFAVEDLIITGTSLGKRDTVMVESKLDLPGDTPDIRIDWRTHKVDGYWKIIDISIEGLSMMTTQREEYVAVIRQGGGKVDYLITALRNKNKKLALRNNN